MSRLEAGLQIRPRGVSCGLKGQSGLMYFCGGYPGVRVHQTRLVRDSSLRGGRRPHQQYIKTGRVRDTRKPVSGGFQS